MTSEFNQWWNSDEMAQANPYRENSPIWWAWEGWQAARNKNALTGIAVTFADEYVEVLGIDRIQAIAKAVCAATETQLAVSYQIASTGAHRWPKSFRPEALVGIEVRII